MKKTELRRSNAGAELQELKQSTLQKELLERLIKTSAALLSGRTREEVLQTILQGVLESGFDRVRLFLLSPDGQTLHGVAQVGMEKERFEGVSWPVTEDYRFQIARQHQLPRIFLPDPTHPDPGEKKFDKADLTEWVIVPLVLRGQVIGQLVADNKFSRRPIHEAELAPLALFGMQAAAVIEKADLSARDEKKLGLFAKLAQATTEIVGQIGKRSLHELLTLVARHACEILAAEVCSVFLYKESNYLSLEAGYGYCEGSFRHGVGVPIGKGERNSFTGYVACEGKLINLHGEALRTHPAVHTHENQFSPSGHCYSVLALPLQQYTGRQEKLVGLLRADNKKDVTGNAHLSQAFTQEDEWILRIFAEVIVVCLESAKLIEHKKLLIGNLPQAVIAIDDKGNVTEFNQEAERILGYAPSEVLGQKVNFLYQNPEEPRYVGTSLDESMDGKLSGYPTMIRTKDGQAVPINLSAYWLHDHHQRSGSVGIFQDLRKLSGYKQQLELTLHAIRVQAEAENLKTGLQRLAELLVARFPGASCGVLLFNESETCLVEQAAAYGHEQFDLPTSPPVSPRQIFVNDFPGLANLLQFGRPFRLRSTGDPLTSANMKKLNEEYGFDPPIQSLLVLPIKFGNCVLGLLDLAEMCSEDQSQFSKQHPENVELAAAIATHSAIFIDRMLNAERGRTQLLSFYEVSSKLIAQKNDPDTLLHEIVEVTSRAAGAVNVDLVLIDEQGRPKTAITFPLDHANRKMEVRPQGISMQVFQDGIARLFPDTGKARAELNPELVIFAEAAVCLPLSLPYKRIGVMWLHYEHPRHFTEQEIAALQLYVNQAAMALENAQEEARQKRVRQVADALAGQTELKGVSQQILASAREVLKADGVIFGFFDHANNTFVPQFSDSTGIEDEIWKQYRDFPLGEHTTAQRLLKRGFVFIPDVDDPMENEILGEKTKNLLKQTGTVTFQAITLKIGQERLGLVGALYRKPHSFGEKERLTVASFARNAALALKKAKLVEQVKKTNEAATAVAKITMLGNRQATLKAIVSEVCEAIGCDAVVLFEYDSDKQRLMPPTVRGVKHPERDFGPEEEYRLVHQVLNENKLRKVEKVSADPDFRYRSFAKNEKIESFIALPLYATGKKVGVIFINYRTPRHFTVEELETMKLFANQAALAIHYAQSTEADERKLRELASLERLSDQLRQAQSLQEMIDCTVALVAQELGTEYCNLILPDRNRELHLHAQYGWDPPLEKFYLEPGVGSQAGYTIQTREAVWVDDYASEDRFKVVEHLRERGIKSSLSVPMFRDGHLVGALIAFTTKLRHFTEEERKFLALIANHAAMAMRSMERYEDLRRRDKHLRAAHNSSRAILASFGDEQKVLDQIIKLAVESVSGINEPKAVMGTLQLYDAERNELEMRGIYPPESLPLLLARVDNGRWSLDKAKAQYCRIGVTGRAIHEGCSQLVGDLSQDHDYIEYNKNSKSELSVLLKADGKIIGAINVESDQLNGFDEYDQFALEALADHAVIAVQIAQTHKALRDTKGLVGTRTAMAWMDLANNTWRHTTAGDAAEVANRVTLIGDYLKEDEITDARVHRHLDQIARLAESIQKRPVTPPLSSEEGVAPTNLNELVTERLQQLRQSNRYDGVELVTAVQPGALLVNVSPEWLRRALDIFIDNAARAARSLEPPDPNRCVVTVNTRLNSRWIELRVSDFGTGIPDEMHDKFLTGEIKSAKGQGVGLLIAQAIVETYGGKIEIAHTGSNGTEMLIRLPHLREEQAGL